MNPEILNRKGVRKAQDIPPEVLQLLNQGVIETVNLTEWLAIDQAQLIRNTFPEMGIPNSLQDKLEEAIRSQKKPSAMNSIKLVGALLYEHYAAQPNYNEAVAKLSSHASDTVRCYAPYLISLNTQLDLEEKFNQSIHLVADKHFGIREVVWIALRPEIDANLEKAIAFLSIWAENEDENIRRFTTEATRPRGVWCKHIEALKEKPRLALPILEKLKSDPSKYVQDSVGNWLNDASKTQAEFVIAICDQWKQVSPTKATLRIIKKARRTIDKK